MDRGEAMTRGINAVLEVAMQERREKERREREAAEAKEKARKAKEEAEARRKEEEAKAKRAEEERRAKEEARRKEEASQARQNAKKEKQVREGKRIDWIRSGCFPLNEWIPRLISHPSPLSPFSSPSHQSNQYGTKEGREEYDSRMKLIQVRCHFPMEIEYTML